MEVWEEGLNFCENNSPATSGLEEQAETGFLLRLAGFPNPLQPVTYEAPKQKWEKGREERDGEGRWLWSLVHGAQGRAP